MAQLNITLDQEEIMGLLADDMGGAFRKLLQESLNAILAAESAEQLKAAPYERTGERTDVRNGSRTRPLTTRVGTIELQVPRHRNVPFKTMVFETYKGSEAALAATMAEMVVVGVSTAKVGRVMEEICGRSFSRSTVSEACRGLDEAVEAYLARPIEGRFPFLMLDATFPKARVNHRIVSRALMIAVGLGADGHKEVLGFGVYDSESNANWLDFAAGLKRRGLSGVRLVTSDAREGIPLAAAEAFPDAPWQRCQGAPDEERRRRLPQEAEGGASAGAGRDVQLRHHRPGARQARRDSVRLRRARAQGHGVPRPRVRRRDDRDGAAGGREAGGEDHEHTREAEPRGRPARERRRRLPERRLREEAGRLVPHRGERQVAAEEEAVLLPGGDRNRGQGAEAGENRQAAGGAEEGSVGESRLRIYTPLRT